MKFFITLLFLSAATLYAQDFVRSIDTSSPFQISSCADKRSKTISTFDKTSPNNSCPSYSLGKILYGTKDDFKFHTTGGHPTKKWGNRNLTSITYKDYVVAFSNKNKLPLWVMSNHEGRIKSNIDESPKTGRGASKFVCDPKLPASLNTNQGDFDNFKDSRMYARGHLYPNALSKNCNGRTATFVTTNIAPQVQSGFNSGPWSTLEDCIRDRVLEEKTKLSIVTGVIYPKRGKSCGFGEKYKDTLKSGLVVPCQFYKIVLDRDSKRYEGFLFQNIEHEGSSKETIKRASTTITNISSLSGLKFFPDIGPKYREKVGVCSR
ncbi:MAG: DNA/RNA endonuclease G (NUC1) [Bacteriovoracaceae bacterium]|jgi:DNA/RNA endonuclease G (NUC1)